MAASASAAGSTSGTPLTSTSTWWSTPVNAERAAVVVGRGEKSGAHPAVSPAPVSENQLHTVRFTSPRPTSAPSTSNVTVGGSNRIGQPVVAGGQDAARGPSTRYTRHPARLCT